MPVIGLVFSSIEAKRSKAPAGGEIKVNSTPKINSVKEASVPSLKKKALSLEFEFVTKYNPDVAEIKISGDIMYLTDKNTQILSQWKKDKKLPEELSVEVLNHLFRRCLMKIAYIAEDLQLPPPIAMPRVKPKSEEASYIG